MRAIVTQEQLDMILPADICEVVSYTDDILDNAGFPNGIKLKECIVGSIEEYGDKFTIDTNLSNASYLPRRVAINDLNEEQISLWTLMLGEENIINQK